MSVPPPGGPEYQTPTDLDWSNPASRYPSPGGTPGSGHPPPGSYPQPQHAQPQYPQPQHAQPQYPQPQHAQPQHSQPQYAQPQLLRPQHPSAHRPVGQYPAGLYSQPYGSGQYPQPYGSGQYPQPYGSGQYPQPYGPVPPRRTNGYAIASLVLGILGGLLLSAIFGFVALSQIRRTGQAGRGLAIAGLVMTGTWLVIIATVVIIALATSATRNDRGSVISEGTVSVTSLRVGDCVNGLQDSVDVMSLPAVPCSVGHEGEVFVVFDLPSGPYPGESGVQGQVEVRCNAELDSYAPNAADDVTIGLFYVGPAEVNWNRDDREVACIATSLDGLATGSVRDR